MGLHLTHGCWNGGYLAFHAWRQNLAKVAGLPPLEYLTGFYSDILTTPVAWERLQGPDPLYALLNHSDRDGSLPWQSCEALANRLEEMLPMVMDGQGNLEKEHWRDKTRQFIVGLRDAGERQEDVVFY